MADRRSRRLPAMALTPDLVALTLRAAEDTGFDESVAFFDDADYAAILADVLARRPVGDVWLFAFGSLIWNPACAFVDQRIGTVHGWHRAFRLGWDTRWRGDRKHPGLMMGLDRGGQCVGMLYRLSPECAESDLGVILRREMRIKPPAGVPITQTGRWLRVHSHGEPIAALGFVMNRRGRAYVGRRPDEETADVLARACGSAGSGAEYLYNTVTKLAEHGIHDRSLWRLQALVAERINRMADGQRPRRPRRPPKLEEPPLP